VLTDVEWSCEGWGAVGLQERDVGDGGSFPTWKLEQQPHFSPKPPPPPPNIPASSPLPKMHRLAARTNPTRLLRARAPAPGTAGSWAASWTRRSGTSLGGPPQGSIAQVGLLAPDPSPHTPSPRH